jgi:hypothetical protein
LSNCSPNGTTDYPEEIVCAAICPPDWFSLTRVPSALAFLPDIRDAKPKTGQEIGGSMYHITSLGVFLTIPASWPGIESIAAYLYLTTFWVADIVIHLWLFARFFWQACKSHQTQEFSIQPMAPGMYRIIVFHSISFYLDEDAFHECS